DVDLVNLVAQRLGVRQEIVDTSDRAGEAGRPLRRATQDVDRDRACADEVTTTGRCRWRPSRGPNGGAD
ncbi:MAG TPA: hypothetical protein VLB49_10320, partial [Gemmatimonadales bacterium]|nr:hypothetical protein [Gemmatimonadales bacterium]